MMTALPASASILVYAPTSCWRTASKQLLMSETTAIKWPCTPLNLSAVHFLQNSCIAGSAGPVTDLSVVGHE